jgi:glycosyltransferase involved in cell wall biosynthesis
LLTPPADEQALARAILRLKTDPALRLRIGREARRRVLDQYDVGKNVERVAEVFRRRLGLRLARKA